jgi:amino acid adenylation domain-containing protein/non-ribosomal peptide synthase protein (TIGR01720 family)
MSIPDGYVLDPQVTDVSNPLDDLIPLSSAQRRLWFFAQMEGGSRAYHIPVAFRLRGKLDYAAFSQALNSIVTRHEVLRTTFTEVDGEPFQQITSGHNERFPLIEHDLRLKGDAATELDRIMSEEANSPFDLERGPLRRGRLMRLGEQEHIFQITMHHIVSDAWSLEVLFRELSVLYRAQLEGEVDPLPDLEIQYSDFAVWQQECIEHGTLRQQADYWKSTLAEAPELLELPTDHPRPDQQSYTGAFVAFELDRELTAELRALSLRHDTTLYMTLFAAWAILLARLSGQQDLLIGTPAANRGRTEIEPLIGFFVNTLAVRLDLSDSPTVSALLKQVREQTVAAQQHQDLPFDQVVELIQPIRSPAHSSLFQVMFAWDNMAKGMLTLPQIEVEPITVGSYHVAKFDLTFTLGEKDETIVGGIEYATSLFERPTIERYLGYFRHLIRAMMTSGTTAVDRLPILSSAERHQLVHLWNDTAAEYPRDMCIHQLVEGQALQYPDATAAISNEGKLTYGELNRRANQLAHYLRELGVGPDVRVAICFEPDFEMIVSLLAVLKAGGAYVPLDPVYPAERLRFMLEDAAPIVLLSVTALADRFAGVTNGDIKILLVDDAGLWNNRAASDPAPEAIGLSPRNLAYVIYTSGSTGTPKGVMVQHSNITHLVRNTNYVAFTRSSTIAHLSNVAFDASIFEIWGALANGCRIALIPRFEVLAPNDLAQQLKSLQVSILFLTTALFNECVRSSPGIFSHLDQLFFGGEMCDPRRIEQLLKENPPDELIHVYGPTETVTFASSFPIKWVKEHSNVPIGRPIANKQIYILDRYDEPIPVGVAGEICVGGVGVARGYLNLPELTSERFAPDPFTSDPGARMYRTGDLGRFLPDGNIEFLGRNDFQVKIRGFRIEPGEVEARLSEHSAVREAVVTADEDASGDRRLVAYYTLVSEQTAPSPEQLRVHLATRLPEYMVPSAYVRMDGFKLTPSGKLDRRSLPEPEQEAFALRSYEPPQGEIEQLLAQVWAELLHLDRVGRHDNFFVLGGHSLLAVRVITRLRQGLSMDIVIRDLFAHPILSELARALESAAYAETVPITRADCPDRIPLSFAQQRLWFLAQMEGGSEAYHIPFGFLLRGKLHLEALSQALDRIIGRHEVLRTTFTAIDGEPVQQITPENSSHFLLLEHDLRSHGETKTALDLLIAEEADAPFDLARGPLLRGRLICLADREHVLLITMHHIVSDGWSLEVLVRELTELYRAFSRGEIDPLPGLELQYGDFAVWQRQWVQSGALQYQAEYWKATLAGAPELLELPTDHPRPDQQSLAGAIASLKLDQQLTQDLKTFSSNHGITLFMTLLGAWSILLARLSGQQDLVIGVPVANRTRSEIEPLIGFFVNTLALRLDLSGSPTVGELLKQVREQSIAAQQHQDLPFEQIVDLAHPVRSLAYTPLFQVMFSWENVSTQEQRFAGLEMEPLGFSSCETSKFDLSFSLQETAGSIVGQLEYATALFERTTIDRYLEYFRNVLQGMVTDDTINVDRVSMLGPVERHQLLYGWNSTRTEYAQDKCIHQLFEEQVFRSPDAVAVMLDEKTLSYEELNRRANQLAHILRELGVRPDARVAVCVDRGFQMIISLLAVLKSGGAYVPFDPIYPVERLRFMIEDASPAALLVQEQFANLFDSIAENIPLILVDRPETGSGSLNTDLDVATVGVNPTHLAYVIYTSGSTGTPKGVMIQHRGVVNELLWTQSTYQLNAGSSVLQKTSFSFDTSISELFWPLITGARFVIAPSDLYKDPTYLAEIIRTRNITVALFVPSELEVFLEYASDIRPFPITHVICGGEPLSAALVQRFQRVFPKAELHNSYGPTETTVDVTAWRVPHLFTQSLVPIGRPIANTKVYLLDVHGEPVPVGVTGELYIGGAGVARGYLNRPELTSEKFFGDRFSPELGERMYRTGDLGRFLPDGNIEFVGRNDFQVKIRGFRIELGEVETRLLEYSALRESIVTTYDDLYGNKQLVVYYTTRPGNTPPSPEQLRGHLTARLPAYMVPSAYVRLDRFTLTPSGKLDRRALPAPEQSAIVVNGYEPPQGEIEQILAQTWTETLNLDRIGRHDNFFALGGHSLLVMRVMSRLRVAFEANFPMRLLFEYPSIAQLAEHLDQDQPESLPVRPQSHPGNQPLSYGQQRLWVLDQLEGSSADYNMADGLLLHGPVDLNILTRTLNTIVQRHESLRTCFRSVDGQPVQMIEPSLHIDIPLVDLRFLCADEQGERVDQALRDETTQPFDLSQAPLVRFQLLQFDNQKYVLIRNFHHIISDGWSAALFDTELRMLYEAFHEGRDNPLQDLPVQYADFTLWQRKRLAEETATRQLNYWTEKLRGIPEEIALPLDRRRPVVRNSQAKQCKVALDSSYVESLKQLSRSQRVTLYMTLLASFGVLLSRYSGEEDIVIGTPIANRGDINLEKLIGFFVNTLVLRLQVMPNQTFLDLLKQVRKTTLEAYLHQDLPFERLVDALAPERSLARSPLFQVVFASHQADSDIRKIADLSVKRIAAGTLHVRCDLELHAIEDNEGRLEFVWVYSSDLFDQWRIEQMARHHLSILERIATSEDTHLDSIEMREGDEIHAALHTRTKTMTGAVVPVTVTELFEQQVALTPDSAALVFGRHTLSYVELNIRTHQLAHYLTGQGVSAEDRVAVYIGSSPEAVVGILATWKAGAAYVPIDPDYPQARITHLFRSAAPRLTLTLNRHMGELPSGTNYICLDAEDLQQTLKIVSSSELLTPGRYSRALPDNAAYIIFTSGSTGNPKGVVVTHRSLSNLALAIKDHFVVTKDSRVLQFASLSFDASIYEMAAALCSGAVLTIPQKGDRVGLALLEVLRSYSITHAVLPPGILGTMPYDQDLPLETLMVAGEACPVNLVDIWAPRYRMLNAYGPTEATVCTTVTAPLYGSKPISIGKPIDNTFVYVLDSRLRPVPVGVTGELYVAGIPVARGYLGQPGLTAGRFIADPFGSPGTRMYRTGDLAQWRTDGNLEFVARADQQIKINGVRIEPGEIEATLRTHPLVQNAAIVVREGAAGRKRIVAYVEKNHASRQDSSELDPLPDLLAWTADRLPLSLVPAEFMWLEVFPLTTNGKVDYSRLSRLEELQRVRPQVPRTEAEATLCAILSELLQCPAIQPDDDFFRLGGDSITSLQFSSRARKADLYFSPRDVFQHRTVANLCKIAKTAPNKSMGASFDDEGDFPVTPIMRWLLEQPYSINYFSQSALLEVPSEVTQEHIVSALQSVIDHHDALRLCIRKIADGYGYSLSIKPRGTRVAASHLKPVDVSTLDVAELTQLKSSEVFLAERRLLPLDGVMMQAVLLHGKQDRPKTLLLTLHHLVVDGVSWRILVEDLSTAWQSAARGEQPSLPVVNTSLRGWARLLTADATTPSRVAEMSFWTGMLSPHENDPLHQPLNPAIDIAGASPRTTITLPSGTTSALLTEVSNVFHIRIHELLLATLALIVTDWKRSGRDMTDGSILIDVEGHGRELHDSGADLSRTVGWFTSMYPMRLDTGDFTIAEVSAVPMRFSHLLQQIKNQLRMAADNGLGFGILRYLNSGTGDLLASLPGPAVSFNYLGRFSSSAAEDHEKFEFVDVMSDSDRPLTHALHFNAMIVDAHQGPELVATFSSAPTILSEEDLRALATGWSNLLKLSVELARRPNMSRITPSDVFLVNLTESDIEALERRYQGIADILPLSPLQDFLMSSTMHQSGATGVYNVQLAIRIVGNLQEERLRSAVEHVFAENPHLGSGFDREVLQRPIQIIPAGLSLAWRSLDLSLLDETEAADHLTQLETEDFRVAFELNAPPLFRFLLVRTGGNQYQFTITNHHIVLDGWSMPLLIARIVAAYRASARTGHHIQDTSYKEYLKWLAEWNHTAARDAWEGLSRLTPTIVRHTFSRHYEMHPRRIPIRYSDVVTRAYSEFANDLKVTLNTLLQAAWAVLLRLLTEKNEVMFGTTVAGRPPEIPGIEESLGLYMNTLPVEARVDPSRTFAEVVADIQAQQIALMPYQHYRLTEIQRDFQCDELFDTAVIFENYPVRLVESDLQLEDVRFEVISARDARHYSLCLLAVRNSSLSLDLEYRSELFSEVDARNLAERFQLLLETAIGNSSVTVAELCGLVNHI